MKFLIVLLVTSLPLLAQSPWDVSLAQVPYQSQSGGTPDTNYATGVNLTSGLSAWRTALANSNSSRIHVVCIGDSKTEGFYTSPDDAVTRFTNAWVGQLRNKLQLLGGGSGVGLLPAYRVGSAYAPYNIDYSSGWSVGTVGNYDGGPFGAGRWGTGDTKTLTVTNVTCTSIQIFYTENQFSGDAFKVDVNGNNVLTNSQAAQTPPIAKSVTINTNLTAGTVTIRCPDASKYLMFNGIAFYNSSTGVFVHNLGQNGKKIADYQTGASWLTNLARALVVVDMDANDYAGHTDTNTYGASFTNILSLYTNSTTSLLLVNGMTNRVAGPPIQAAYWAVERRLTNFNPAVLSMDDYYGGYSATWYQDATHPNQNGHSNQANVIYGVLNH